MTTSRTLTAGRNRQKTPSQNLQRSNFLLRKNLRLVALVQFFDDVLVTPAYLFPPQARFCGKHLIFKGKWFVQQKKASNLLML
jgi:hypothetical protein